MIGLFALAVGMHAQATEVEVNQASVSELQSLKGIGPVMAQRIVQARAQQRFVDWDDLQRRVPGLGPKTAEKLSVQGLRVQGKSFGSGLAQQAALPHGQPKAAPSAYPYIPGLSAPRR